MNLLHSDAKCADTVAAKSLRIGVQLQDSVSGGVLEWKIK
jgi:hypothetical protein